MKRILRNLRFTARAVRMIRASPYLFVRRHEWRGIQIDDTKIWPRITLGWRTWDTLPEQIGQRQAEVLDTLRGNQ